MKFNWKRLLNFSQGDVLGLDIGSSSVRMVQIHRDGTECTVTAANITEIRDAQGDDSCKDSYTIDAIRDCILSSGVSTRQAVCSVSGSEVAVRHFKFPPLEPEEIEGAIRLEAAQVCPFNIEDGVIDYKVIPNGKDAVCGIFVAATRNVVKKKVRLAKEAAIDCVLMDVDGLALLNCLNENNVPGRQETATAILDVGASCTTLAIMSDNKLPFVRNMPYAGKDIIAQIADENGLTSEDVKNELFGSEGRSLAQPQLGAGLPKACQKLMADVADTLRYHTAQEKTSTVDQILVCGGFATANGFVEALNAGLSVKSVLWNPFDEMRSNVPREFLDVIRSKGPALAVAVGLALRTI